MIRNPVRDPKDSTKPFLGETEKLLFTTSNCTIQFGDISSRGFLYITTERLVFLEENNQNINNNNNNNNSSSSSSFSIPHHDIIVHGLSNEDSTNQYLFVQIENQNDRDLIIKPQNFDCLDEMYKQLNEGQKLNPCEDQQDSDSNGAVNDSNNVDAVAKHLESVLTIDPKLEAQMKDGGMVDFKDYENKDGGVDYNDEEEEEYEGDEDEYGYEDEDENENPNQYPYDEDNEYYNDEENGYNHEDNNDYNNENDYDDHDHDHDPSNEEKKIDHRNKDRQRNNNNNNSKNNTNKNNKNNNHPRNKNKHKHARDEDSDDYDDAHDQWKEHFEKHYAQQYQENTKPDVEQKVDEPLTESDSDDAQFEPRLID